MGAVVDSMRCMRFQSRYTWQVKLSNDMMSKRNLTHIKTLFRGATQIETEKNVQNWNISDLEPCDQVLIPIHCGEVSMLCDVLLHAMYYTILLCCV